MEAKLFAIHRRLENTDARVKRLETTLEILENKIISLEEMHTTQKFWHDVGTLPTIPFTKVKKGA